jgi:hypothetical protein
MLLHTNMQQHAQEMEALVTGGQWWEFISPIIIFQ